MVEKYLIWPARLFLYFSCLALLVFYSIIFSLSINAVSKAIISTTVGERISYDSLSVKPRLLGIEIEGQNFGYQEKDIAFKVERINLDLDFLKTLLKNKFYLNESEIYNGSLDFIGTSENVTNLNFQVESANFKNFKFETLEFKNLVLNNVISGYDGVGFDFSRLDLKLPGNLQQINNLDGIGYLIDRELKLLVNSTLGELDVIGFDRFLFPDLRGFIHLDFADGFKIPKGHLFSGSNQELVNAYFVFNQYFNLVLNQQGDSNRIISALPANLDKLAIFLDESNFYARDVNLLLSYSSRGQENSFDSIAIYKDLDINLSGLKLRSVLAKSHIDSKKFSLFSEKINTGSFSLDKFNISKKHADERFQVHLNLLGNSFWSRYYNQKGSEMIWFYSNPESKASFSIGGSKTVFSQGEYVIGLDLPNELDLGTNGVQINPMSVYSNFFDFNDSFQNALFFNFQKLRLEEINTNASFKKNNLTPDGLDFKNLSVNLKDGFFDFGLDAWSVGGEINIAGSDVIYNENTFTPGILGVLSLIDIRSNIIDLLSLDFDKLNTENILVDNLKGNLFLDGNNFINIDAIELNFGSAQANISGIVSSNIEYLDTYDLNLVFDSNISQNIPWYFALFGNIPAAAGAAVISNLLEQDGNKLFSAKYKISGTTDELEVSPMQ